MGLEPAKTQTDKLTCADRPCPSCPYRKATPKGVWALDHYEALTKYDGEIHEQAAKGAFTQFACHYDTGNLCRGWLDCHGPDNLLALRMSRKANELGDIGEPKEEVYESGEAVLEANLPHMDSPSPEARDLMVKLLVRHGKKYNDE